MSSSTPDTPVIRIEPSKGLVSLHLKDVWEYRELLYFLTWRDIKVRYKQSLLGVGWSVLQPLLTMIIFTFVFGRFAGVPSEGIPYPLFSFAALLPWQYFASAVGRSGVSIVNSSNLIAKVYFPRLIIPLSAAIAPAVDFAVTLVMLILLMAYYGVLPTMHVVFLPAFFLLTFAAAMAVSVWLSALHVRYRDVGYVIPFLVQIWMFISPVAYPSSLVPEQWRFLYGLNPMAGVIEGFRWALFGQGHPPDIAVGLSVVVTLVVLLGGLFFFQKTEETFADIV